MSSTLRRFREDSGRTQTDAAAFLKRNQGVVSKCERGERRIDVIELRVYCRAIGIELRTFVDMLEREITHARSAKASLKIKKRGTSQVFQEQIAMRAK